MNLLSAYQARLNGFMSRISNDNLKITLFNKDQNLVLVFYEDSNDHLYKCHANTISKMVKKLYKQELLKVYSEGSVYNIAQFYTMEQQARAQEAIRSSIGQIVKCSISIPICHQCYYHSIRPVPCKSHVRPMS